MMGIRQMAMKQTKRLEERTPSKTGGTKAARKPNKSAKGKATRTRQYLDVFVPQPALFGSDDFFPQVDGYGTPIVARVGSFAGV